MPSLLPTPTEADDFAALECMAPAEADAPTTELMVLGEGDTAAVVVVDTLTGEVVDIEGAPGHTAAADACEIAEWLGPRLSAALARLAGLEAEKASWVAKINVQYDARIKREQSYIAFLRGEWAEPLRVHAAELLQNIKNRRSVGVGLLTLAFKKKPGKRKITDEPAALDYLGRVCPDAVKMTPSVLVSRIPDDLMENLPAGCGLQWIPPHDEFEVR